MDIPLVQGRLFSDEDLRTGPRVGIVDQRMAEALWPGGNALGRRIKTGGIDASNTAPWITIVGVVGNVKQDALDTESRMALYFPHSQLPGRTLNVVVRTNTEPSALAAPVRKQLHDIDPDLPVYNVRTMKERVDASLARRRFSMLLFAIFATVASGLAAVGVYGVIAFLVSQGTKEMGIRMALGATPGGIALLVVRHALLIAAAAVVLGAVTAIAVTRVMRSLLFGVNAVDPLTYVLVCMLVALTAVAASYLPARRAARLDPMRALR
jgi:predicted permease